MKILFLPMDGHGHVNSCIGLASVLKEFGHECTFVVGRNWRKVVEPHGFPVETIDMTGLSETKDPQKKWGAFMRERSKVFAMSPKDQVTELIAPANWDFVRCAKRSNDQFEQIIKRLKPDLIIYDWWTTIPALVNSGIPWVLLFSCNPLLIYSRPEVPPYGSGLGAGDDPKLFKEIRDWTDECLKEVKREFDEFLRTKGIDPNPEGMLGVSPYLNVYSYPSELDYAEYGPVPEKWFRVDHMVRPASDAPLGIDESFFNTTDKIILFSLGSLGSSNVDLMKRLISFLGKSKHKFVVSKGPFHDQYELAPNMTGGQYLNQMKIIPRVDLVIHHGGNNSFVETLYFGKPFIVMPLFGDQHDNGRRAVDKGIGKCFYPYKVTESELLRGIDELLEDRGLIERVKKIGETIRASKSHSELNEKLKQIAKK